MAGPSHERLEAFSSINVTPFVDVVLVLLIILMVMSPHIVKASLAVDLPRAASAGETVERTLNVVVDDRGSLILDGDEVDAQTLAHLTREARAHHPEVRAVISADRNAPYHTVIRAIDIVKSNGVTRFALDVEREAPGGGPS